MSSEEISKVNKLSVTESFLQVNFDKGYKYIDRAGQLINEFYLDGVEPNFQMDLSGLVLKQPKGIAEQIKVTPKAFWSHYKSPDSLDLIKNHYLGNLKKVSAVLDVTLFNRVGWRTYFVKEFNTVDNRTKALKKLQIDEAFDFNQGSYEGILESYNVTLRLNKVSTITDSQERALLIDIDIYTKKETPSNLVQIESDLGKMFEAIKSDKVLALVNKIIGE